MGNCGRLNTDNSHGCDVRGAALLDMPVATGLQPKSPRSPMALKAGTGQQSGIDQAACCCCLLEKALEKPALHLSFRQQGSICCELGMQGIQQRIQIASIQAYLHG